MNLTTFIWDKFEDYFAEKDSYKDSQGKGLLQRFLLVFGMELQTEIVPKLENLINEKDPETASDEFLSELAYSVGRPNDILQDIDKYRTLLTQIISIYQIKGTTKSYQLLFALFGLTAELVEHFPPDNAYDSGLIYDDDTEDAQVYDQTNCEVGCIDYSINYDNLPGQNVAPLSQQQEEDLRLMISDFIEPIDCNLRDLTYVNAPPPLTVNTLGIYNNSAEPTTYDSNGSGNQPLGTGSGVTMSTSFISFVEVAVPANVKYTLRTQDDQGVSVITELNGPSTERIDFVQDYAYQVNLNNIY